MLNKIKWFGIGLGLVAFALYFWPSSDRGHSDNLMAAEAVAAGADLSNNIFAKIARDQTPAVVNISTKQKVNFGGQHGMPDEMREFYERFFPGFKGFPREQVRQSLGSGFVVEDDGYILTNSHVVAKADEIVVTFGDGHDSKEKEYNAKLVAADPKTDIALIKIEADKKFPTLKLGNSDMLEVGEWVMAIGNPFGFAQSVTVGVVSAKSRVIGAGPYDDFIQTDASINPGNSGGPLLNINGQVVGINSAIFTGGMSQGNVGIGFAIPINAVKSIYNDLKAGQIKRGWLGVAIQGVSEELQTVLNLPSASGALISEVFSDSPAEKGGLMRKDVIIAFNGEEVETSSDLPRIVAAAKPGAKATLKIIRDGKEKMITMKLGNMPDDQEELVTSNGKGGAESLGMAVENLDRNNARKFSVEAESGVLVTSVTPGSPAAESGVRPGDVISEVKGQPVESASQFEKIVSSAKPGEAVLLLVSRGKNTSFIVVKIPSEE